jgi:hypothetical protein
VQTGPANFCMELVHSMKLFLIYSTMRDRSIFVNPECEEGYTNLYIVQLCIMDHKFDNHKFQSCIVNL